MTSSDASAACKLSRNEEEFDVIQFSFNPVAEVSPTIMVYDLPALPPSPPVRCLAGSTMTSCLGDTLESDRSSVTMATDTDTIMKPLDLAGLSNDDKETGAVHLSITIEKDTAYLPADPCDPVQRVTSAPRDSPALSLESSVSLQSVTSHAPSDPRQAASEDDCLASSSASASWSLDEGLVDACFDTRCVVLLKAYVERQQQRQRQMQILQADMHHAIQQRMAAVEKVLADDLELRERVRNEERWSERKRHQRRLEGLPGWLRRLGLALRGLKNRRPKDRASSCGTEEEEGGSVATEDPEVDELGRVARDVSRSQVLLERLRKADVLARVRRAAAKDERLQSQLTDRLRNVERTYATYREQLHHIAREDTLDLANMRAMLSPGSSLDSLEFGLNDSTCAEEMVVISRPGSGFHENLLLPPANWDFGPDSTARGPLDDEEEKRRRKEILKRKKPKKMGLKRRFFLCLRCLT